jgi:hypothetical protein
VKKFKSQEAKENHGEARPKTKKAEWQNPLAKLRELKSEEKSKQSECKIVLNCTHFSERSQKLEHEVGRRRRRQRRVNRRKMFSICKLTGREWEVAALSLLALNQCNRRSQP